jgi:hypothetical protein
MTIEGHVPVACPASPGFAGKEIVMLRHKYYLFDLGYEIKLFALQVRRERDAARENSEERTFRDGLLYACYRMISLMQQQAEGFGIPLSDLRLDDIDPDRDLI